MSAADSAAAASGPEEACEVEVRKKNLSSTPTSLSSSASQHLLAAFLVRFADGEEGAGWDSSGEGSGMGGSGGDVRTGSVQELLRLAGERC
jgi:hypothetical protein